MSDRIESLEHRLDLVEDRITALTQSLGELFARLDGGKTQDLEPGDDPGLVVHVLEEEKEIDHG